MKESTINLIGIIIIVLFVGIVGFIIFKHTANDNLGNFQNITEAQAQVKALCPFLCIDSGFEDGYYTNWINKCVCRKKQ